MAEGGNATVFQADVQAYITQLCAARSTAGATIAADLLSDDEAAHKAFVATLSTCTTSDQYALLQEFADHINPPTNTDVDEVVLWVAGCAAEQGLQTAAGSANVDDALWCIGVRRCLHLSPPPSSCLLLLLPCLCCRYATAWSVAGEELGVATCVTIAAVDRTSGKVIEQTVHPAKVAPIS